MAIGLLILPNKLRVLSTISISLEVLIFYIAKAQQTYICKGYSNCIDPDYVSAMATGTKYVMCKKYHSHNT
jgi:hypothetical protein